MKAGAVLYDLFYVALATSLYAGALWAGATTGAALTTLVAWPLVVLPAVLVGVLVLIAEVGLLIRVVPHPAPGRHRLMSRPFLAWAYHSQLRRALWFGPLKP